MAKTLLETLKERVLVSDGAMGTQLMACGLESGNCGEVWNVQHPDRVLEIQRRYVNSGSDCLITNTFGANGLMLKRHGHFEELYDINVAAAKVAREAFGGKQGFVLGGVGPVGGVLEPYGELKAEEVHEAVYMQVKALIDGGVDAIIIETQLDLYETELGVRAARDLGAPCIIASMAYDRTLDGSAFRTMMGVDPERAAEYLSEIGVDILAFNCGSGVDMNVAERIVKEYRQVSDRFTMAQPNAGLPVLENFKAVYKQTPEEMVEPLDKLLAAGVNIVGGCCGSTPDHIKAIREKVDAWNEKQNAEKV